MSGPSIETKSNQREVTTMYEALQAVAADMASLEATLDSPTSHARVARLTSALDATAQRLSDKLAAATAERERAHLQTLHRGFVAAGRVVQRLADLKAQAGIDA
ncbi:type III secretion protein [Trinickia acidisoli]|uniref:type III secretion protein n=1 Tax=Trinickia acidisoli TaxID=2767482 RepID=UPI001A8F5D49|nr:type III secretion protein [Trinickia acidisoli]